MHRGESERVVHAVTCHRDEVTVSVGAATLTDADQGFDDLLERANAARHTATDASPA